MRHSTASDECVAPWKITESFRACRLRVCSLDVILVDIDVVVKEVMLLMLVMVRLMLITLCMMMVMLIPKPWKRCAMFVKLKRHIDL